MRRPTSVAAMYAWHRACLAGQRPATHEDDVQCGWFRCRMVRGGPWVPARIALDRDIDPMTGELTRDEVFIAILDGERRDPVSVWNWVNGNPISKEQFDALCALREGTPSMSATHIPMDLSERAMRP